MFLAFQRSCQLELNVNYKQNIGNWLPIQHKLWDLMKKFIKSLLFWIKSEI